MFMGHSCEKFRRLQQHRAFLSLQEVTDVVRIQLPSPYIAVDLGPATCRTSS